MYKVWGSIKQNDFFLNIDTSTRGQIQESTKGQGILHDTPPGHTIPTTDKPVVAH